MGSKNETYRICIDIDGEEYDITDALKNALNTIVADQHEIDDDDLPFCDMDCDGCEDCDDWDECVYDDDIPFWGIPDIRRVVFSGPATIVFWADGTKTIVKCMEGEKFEQYAGFIAACAKKMFGSTSRAKAIMNECAYVELPKLPKKEQKSSFVGKRADAMAIDEHPGVDHETIKEAVNEAFER